MPRLFIASLLLAVKLAPVTANFYPDWLGQSGTCSNGSNPPSLFVSNTGYYEPTLAACCTRYYSGTAYTDCINGTGATHTGTGMFYIDYTTAPHSCAKDCVTNHGDPACGGVLPTNSYKQKHTSSETCCTTHLNYLAKDYCVAASNGQAWTGSNDYYVDSSENMCVKDCEGAAPCGGITQQSHVVKYDTIALCCAGKLSWLNADFCAAQSDPAVTGTNNWFVKDNICKKDCTGTGPECATMKAGDRSRSTAALCCSELLSWVTKGYCESRSDPATLGIGGKAETHKWYIDYTKQACSKDCATSGDAACSALSTDGKSTPLNDTPEKCCASGGLSWIDAATCKSASEAGSSSTAAGTAAVAVTGTNKWYAVFASTNRCVQDCTTASGTACGGVVGTSSGVSTYPDAKTCCSQRFGWYQQDLCKGLSEGAGTANTGLWYADYSSQKSCFQDCPTGQGAQCKGNPTDVGTPMFKTAKECCTTKLNWVGGCENKSIGGADAPEVATGEWYLKSSQDKHCKQDCAVGSGTGCGGIAEKNSWTTMYKTAKECCKAKLSWIQSEVCEAQSDGSKYTNKFWPDKGKGICYQDCATGTGLCGGNPKDTSVTLHSSIEKCCKTDASWKALDVCTQGQITGTVAVPGSAPVPAGSTSAGTTQWWINDKVGKCVQNCPTGQGTACGGIKPGWGSFYSDAATCCKSSQLSWKKFDACAMGAGTTTAITPVSAPTAPAPTAPAPTPPAPTPPAPTPPAVNNGTSKWYISGGKCGQDCPTSQGSSCHGLKPSWGASYSTAASCCASSEVAWKPISQCQKGSTVVTSVRAATAPAPTAPAPTPPAPTPPASVSNAKWYISGGKCGQDCPTSQGSSCHGRKPSWGASYSTAASCCASSEVSWKPFNDCVQS